MNVRKKLDELGFKGREIFSEKIFKGSKEDFESYYQALTHAKSLGYVMGSMQADSPIAGAKAMSYVAKWRNIARYEYPKIEALLIPLEEEYLFVELEEVK